MEVVVPSEELFPVFCVALMKTLAEAPRPPVQPHPLLPSRYLYPSSSCKCGPNMLKKSSLSLPTPTRRSRRGSRASVKDVSRWTLMTRYKVSTCKLDIKSGHGQFKVETVPLRLKATDSLGKLSAQSVI